MIERLSKNYELLNNDKLNVVYGTLNRLNPSILFFNGKMWIKPTCKMDYVNESSEVCKVFKKNLKKVLLDNKLFDRKYICEFDIKPIGFCENKSKFISFEIVLKQKNVEHDITKLKNDMIEMFNPLFDELINDFNLYNFEVNSCKF